MKISLPYPPTANLYWRHAQGRTFLSAAAKAFKVEVRKRLAAAKVTPQEGPLALHVHVYRPRKVGDLDNTLKVLGDALNGAAWYDDKQVVEIHAYRHDDKENPRAEVEVLPAMLKYALQSWEPATPPHSCKNCEGIQPETCLVNPHRKTGPRKGDAAKARAEGRKRLGIERDPVTGLPAAYYTPPRSRPVGASGHMDGCDLLAERFNGSRCTCDSLRAAKEAEATFAPAVCCDTFRMLGRHHWSCTAPR